MSSLCIQGVLCIPEAEFYWYKPAARGAHGALLGQGGEREAEATSHVLGAAASLESGRGVREGGERDGGSYLGIAKHQGEK